jgi:hypothetical protein
MIRGLLRVAARAVTIQLEEAAAARTQGRVGSSPVEQHATSRSQLDDPARNASWTGQDHPSASIKHAGLTKHSSSTHATVPGAQPQHHPAEALPADAAEESPTTLSTLEVKYHGEKPRISDENVPSSAVPADTRTAIRPSPADLDKPVTRAEPIPSETLNHAAESAKTPSPPGKRSQLLEQHNLAGDAAAPSSPIVEDMQPDVTVGDMPPVRVSTLFFGHADRA